MSNRKSRASAAAQSQALAQNVAQDGIIGAGFGLLLASGLIASDIDIWRNLADSGRPIASLAMLVAAVVLQCAVVGGLGGVAFRSLLRSE
jgi:hypothetical protein